MENNTENESSESSPAVRPSPLMAWGQLVRLPNVFTVVADVSAAFLFVSSGPQPILRMALVVAAGVALYWAGMILNDVFDVERDRSERSGRPLAAGHIPVATARNAGIAFLLSGIALAAISGYLPSEQLGTSWLPAAVATTLAIMIVAYDGPLKATSLAPWAMGSCRVLSFLLGAAVGLGEIESIDSLFPKHIVAIALGFGIYVVGITSMARHEAGGGPSPDLYRGFVISLIGFAMLAFAPQTATEPLRLHLSPRTAFPLMIGMIAMPVVLRGLRAVGDPTPANIQITIKIGVLSIIPLAAAYAFLGAGATWGLAVFALWIPSLLLSSRFRVT